jgi:hypothetical protein
MMRGRLTGLTLVVLIGLIPSAAAASPLADKQFETSFTLSYVNVNSAGKTTNLDGDWSWIFVKGYSEVGLLVSYTKIDPDFGISTDSTIIGPQYTWNWMPDKDAGTGYLSASYGFVGGDPADFFDSAVQAAVGAKLFVGDSAAVRIEYFFQRFLGSKGFSDQDSNGLAIGISIFGGRTR